MRNYTRDVGIIALSNLKGIGPAFVKKVAEDGIFSGNDLLNGIMEITTANNKIFDEGIIAEEIEGAKNIVFSCKEEGISIITILNERYPLNLKSLKDPPPVLYCKGDIALLGNKIVGIIGTRQPNGNGSKIAERVGNYFAEKHWSICNGLAEGIDTFSILNSSQVRRKVIGVLAGGLNFDTQKTLLKKTKEIARLVLDADGLLVSESAPGIKENSFSVVKACRIQAGLSNGLIIVQSGLEGGSKYTVKAFCESERPLGVIKPLPEDYHLPSYEANRELIENGITALSSFSSLKEKKIFLKKILAIKSRNDYENFENLMQSIRKQPTLKSLFD